MPGPGPATFRGPVPPGSTGTLSGHLKCVLFPDVPSLDSPQLPSVRRRSRCSHLGCAALAACPPVPCSIQLRFPAYSKIPWLSPPPQLPHPRPACLPPCPRLSAYLLPSSWNFRGLLCLMRSREAFRLPACHAIPRLPRWRCDPPSNHRTRVRTAKPEFAPCPSTCLPRDRALSLLSRLRRP